jgi:hypothetical protein
MLKAQQALSRDKHELDEKPSPYGRPAMGLFVAKAWRLGATGSGNLRERKREAHVKPREPSLKVS